MISPVWKHLGPASGRLQIFGLRHLRSEMQYAQQHVLAFMTRGIAATEEHNITLARASELWLISMTGIACLYVSGPGIMPNPGLMPALLQLQTLLMTTAQLLSRQ